MTPQEWFINVDGEVQGPFSPRELRDLAAQKSIIPTTNIRLGERGEWMLAESVSGLFSTTSVKARTKSGRPQWSSTGPMPVLNSNEYIAPGWKIEATFPVVRARRVFGINAFAELKIAARDVVGGRSLRAEEAFETMEDDVIEELCQKASDRGCHALIRLKLQHGTIERGAGFLLYVTGMATPITLEPDQIEE